ncbi:MAG: hypothetical protein ABS948_09970 [Solibacillus sp.]
MDYSFILMGVGILFILLSFFMKDKSSKVETELEELSISLYQETNALKRRLKIVEEELMLEPSFQVAPKKAPAQPKNPMATFQQVTAQLQQAQAIPPAPAASKINSILVSQVQALHAQGLSLDEISQRSTLSHEQIESILGGRQ